MKVLIQNKYIDFSVVTHIEDNGHSLFLFVLGGEKIKIGDKHMSSREYLSSHPRMRSLPSIEEDPDENWQEEKAKVIEIWNNTESQIKDIKVL